MKRAELKILITAAGYCADNIEGRGGTVKAYQPPGRIRYGLLHRAFAGGRLTVTGFGVHPVKGAYIRLAIHDAPRQHIGGQFTAVPAGEAA